MINIKSNVPKYSSIGCENAQVIEITAQKSITKLLITFSIKIKL